MKDAREVATEILTELDLGEGLGEGERKTTADLTHALQSGWLEGDTIIDMIVSAIELDRAQRPANGGPEHDTLERALWRIETVLAGFYDGETEEPVQALGDLMTDILHWCDYHDRSLSHAQDRATQMVDWERADWGLPSIHISDRMFRKSGPIIRQRRSEREVPIDTRRESPNTDSRAGSGEH